MNMYYGPCCGLCAHYCYEDAIDKLGVLKNVPVNGGYVDADIGYCPHAGDVLEEMDKEAEKIRFNDYGVPNQTGSLYAYRWSTHAPCTEFERFTTSGLKLKATPD